MKPGVVLFGQLYRQRRGNIACLCTADLHAAVEAEGLFYPPDPASADTSTLGGNVATNAGGLRALKYGVTRDYVLGLEVVLPDLFVEHSAVPTDPETVDLAYWGLWCLALLLGGLLVIPIGGADMPVVIALLNSYSGLAAAATGVAALNVQDLIGVLKISFSLRAASRPVSGSAQ